MKETAVLDTRIPAEKTSLPSNRLRSSGVRGKPKRTFWPANNIPKSAARGSHPCWRPRLGSQ